MMPVAGQIVHVSPLAADGAAARDHGEEEEDEWDTHCVEPFAMFT